VELRWSSVGQGVELPSLRDKYTAETCLHNEWRCTDHASLSSCLTLQSHPRHVFGRISDYDTMERRVVRACIQL
jgi:hypothetical protein